jgi:hypothetical protein
MMMSQPVVVVVETKSHSDWNARGIRERVSRKDFMLLRKALVRIRDKDLIQSWLKAAAATIFVLG